MHYARVVDALTLKDHEIILECYHPSVKISTPYLFCNYLGTPGIAECGENPTLGTTHTLYARFRPVLQEDDRRPRARYPTRAVIEGLEQPLDDIASHDIHLDVCEGFSQLVTVTNLVKVEPRRGLITNNVNMTDGVIRVFRDWLAREAAKGPNAKGKQRATGGPNDSDVLWADLSQNCGLRMRAVEKSDMRAPVLQAADDEPAISYELEFEGM